MKKLAKAVLGVALLSGVVLATPTKPATTREPKAQEKFEHVKARIINMIDKRMGFLERHKTCVERAKNWKELKGCRPHRRMWHKPMRRWKKK